MLQIFQVPKNPKIYYRPSGDLNYTIVPQKMKITPLDEEVSTDLKDKKLLATIKKARLEYEKGLTTSEEEVTKLLSD